MGNVLRYEARVPFVGLVIAAGFSPDDVALIVRPECQVRHRVSMVIGIAPHRHFPVWRPVVRQLDVVDVDVARRGVVDDADTRRQPWVLRRNLEHVLTQLFSAPARSLIRDIPGSVAAHLKFEPLMRRVVGAANQEAQELRTVR